MLTTNGHATRSRFARGFDSLEHEARQTALRVEGTVPAWLRGALLRNGPAKFETDRRSLRHWFDGQAMLHRFSIVGGRVSYSNRFLESRARQAMRDHGRIAYREFATDPCAGLFGRFFTRFAHPTDNPNVNVVKLADRMLALTETPLPIEFDADTLETLGVVEFSDKLRANVTTAHPHLDPRTGELVNYTIRFGPRSEYGVYRLPRGSQSRETIAKAGVREPSYMHSFAMTERHVILAEFPLVVNPLSLLLSGRPFIENYRWRPERGTRLTIVDRSSGAISVRETEPFFAFHHVNAFEQAGALVLDIAAYDDHADIGALYLDNLRSPHARLPSARLRRLRIPLASVGVSCEQIADEAIELPRIDERRETLEYRIAYGVGAAGDERDDFSNQLIKLDTETGRAHIWHEADCYPGEPVHVPAPDTATEDDGVILSIVLDLARDASFLLVLDAKSFQEMARAYAPHQIPFGFHGQFYRDD